MGKLEAKVQKEALSSKISKSEFQHPLNNFIDRAGMYPKGSKEDDETWLESDLQLRTQRYKYTHLPKSRYAEIKRELLGLNYVCFKSRMKLKWFVLILLFSFDWRLALGPARLFIRRLELPELSLLA